MKRVLVVTYYFPPAGGPGVQRVLKLVKYLAEFGWQPTVLTVEGGSYPQRDPALARDVPPGVRVVRAREWTPFGAYARLSGRSRQEAMPVGHLGASRRPVDRLARWVRANVFIPDARVGWVPFATRRARRLVAEAARAGTPFDAVLTTGPPHSTHLVGRALRKRAGVPWAADFRDPWAGLNVQSELPMSSPARALDARLERAVLRAADRLVTVSPTWARELVDRAERPAPIVAVVHNGFDEADFEDGESEPEEGVFTLAHVGSLYGPRNPVAVWEALALLRADGRLDGVRLRFVGPTDDGVREALAQHGLADLARFEPYVPHDAAVRAMRSASLLLLAIEPFAHEQGMLTGKLYEYLASGRPILGVGPADGDAARLLDETGGGRVFDRADVDGIAAFVARHVEAWRQGRPVSGAPWPTIAPYSRRAQTGRFAAVLDAMPAKSSGYLPADSTRS